MSWQDTITGDEATEALAEAWASMDGVLETFQHAKTGPDHDGYYEGYLSDANEMRKRLLKRGYAIVPALK